MSASKFYFSDASMVGDLKLPRYYGAVILVGVASQGVNMFLATRVMAARKEHNVKYPALYSPDNDKFNCVQRAHQNYLEGYSTFLMSLFIGGLQYPRFAAGCGLVYLLGRIFYYRGYATGDPAKRSQGAISYIGGLPLFISLIVFGVRHLRESLQ